LTIDCEILDSAIVKTIASLFLAVAAAALTSCATSTQTGSALGTQLGPHGMQKMAIIRMHPGERAGDSREHMIVLVLRVDSTLEKGEQAATATATVHVDGPNGGAEKVQHLTVHIMQPADAKGEEHDKYGKSITATFPAPNGKYKAVMAEAMMTSPKFDDTKVTVTVPGD
jgi:hypothetical protein